METAAPLLLALLRRRAAEHGRQLAVAAGTDTLSYADLLADATALARGYIASGVSAGDRVGLVMPAGLDFVRAVFGVQLAGAALCAVNPTLPPATALRRAALVRPAVVAVADDLLPALVAAHSAGDAPLASLGSLSRDAPARAPLPEEAGRDRLAYLQLTSGTTGEPRAAMVSHGALAAYVSSLRQALQPRRDDAFVVWVPPWHDLGLLYAVFAPLAFGCPAHVVPPAIATLGLWLETISRVGGTFTGAPDFAYRLACRLVEPRGLDLSRLRCATNGGEPVRLQTIRDFEARFGVPGVVRPGYGQAEATLGIALLRPGEPLRTTATGALSCGRPLPGVTVRIVDDDGLPLPAGEPGEIAVRTPAAFSGYFEAPEETARVLRDGWLLTGDIGLLDERGEVYVLGRRRVLLKRAGSPLAPRELEEAAEAVPGVRSSAAVGLTDGVAGERIVLVVEAAATVSPAGLIAAVAAAARAALGFAPEVLLVAPREIPRTENGKVRHAELRRRLEEGVLPTLSPPAGGRPHA